MDIHVNGQQCYGWSKDAAPDTVAHVVCDQTLVGEEVTIRIPGQFLSLCEVQVFGKLLIVYRTHTLLNY